MLDLRNKIVQTILVYFSLVCLFVCWSFLLRCVALVPTTAFFLFVLYLLLLGFLLIFLLTLLCALRMWSWREMLIANWLIRPGLICLHQIKASPWGGFSLGKKILYCTTLDNTCDRICLICASSRTLYYMELTFIITCIKQLQIRMSYICRPEHCYF